MIKLTAAKCRGTTLAEALIEVNGAGMADKVVQFLPDHRSGKWIVILREEVPDDS